MVLPTRWEGEAIGENVRSNAARKAVWNSSERNQSLSTLLSSTSCKGFRALAVIEHGRANPLYRVRVSRQRICRIPATTGLLFAATCSGQRAKNPGRYFREGQRRP